MKFKKPMTAAEAMEILKNDKEYQKKIEAKEKESIAFNNMLKKDSKHLINDLHRAGFNVKSVWDLVNRSEPYPDAITILIKHLKHKYLLRTKEGIARALAVPDAKCAWDVLVDEYNKAIPDEKIIEPQNRSYKAGLAVALSFLADKSKLDMILNWIENKNNGNSRIFFLDKIYKYRDMDKVKETILKLKDDEYLRTMIKKKFLN